MKEVLQLTEQERSELYTEAAQVLGWSAQVIEKDFWVCWTLQRLFEDPCLKRQLTFKGGTSLSKVVASDRPFLGGYLQRQVKIELGARSDGWPAELRSLQPYIAKAFPEILKQSDCKITVLALERTFWEKATILHAESHRPPEKATPLRFSRHYYDLAMLADHPKGKEAVKRSDLRDRVVEHKQIFFPATWACYEQAVPGSIRLIPGETPP